AYRKSRWMMCGKRRCACYCRNGERSSRLAVYRPPFLFSRDALAERSADASRLNGLVYSHGARASHASTMRRGSTEALPAKYASRHSSTWCGVRFAKHSRVAQVLIKLRSNCGHGLHGNWRVTIALHGPSGAKRRHGLPPKMERTGWTSDARCAVPESVAIT